MVGCRLCVCSAFPSVDYQSYVQHQQQHPGLMYYGPAVHPPPMAPSPLFSGFTPYGAEQMQWMQQAYAQSMMHYMQQYVKGVIPCQFNQGVHHTPSDFSEIFCA